MICRRAIEPVASAGEKISSTDLRKGDIIYTEAGDLIPVDGEIVSGIALVNESAIIGESVPVIREKDSSTG